MSGEIFFAAAGMGPKARGQALVAKDGFSARYDLDRVRGVFRAPITSLPARAMSAGCSCSMPPKAASPPPGCCTR